MLLYELFELDSDPDWLRPGGAECLSLPPCSPFPAWTSTWSCSGDHQGQREDAPGAGAPLLFL